MGGGDLNLKKSWHPSTLRNIERVWKAEQKHEVEKQKIEQLQKELADERAREEIQAYAEDQGVVRKREERLDWMYQGPATMVNREEYLLGRKIDKTLDLLQQQEKGTEPKRDNFDVGATMFSSQDLSGSATVDLANKIREDPLFSIMKKEKEQKKNLLSNPVKMKQLQRMIQESLGKRKKKKGSCSDSESEEKHWKKHKDKKRKHTSKHRGGDEERLRRSSSSANSTKYCRSNTDDRILKNSSRRSYCKESKRVDEEERQQRLLEMQDNAKWREVQRQRNIKRYRDDDEKEDQGRHINASDFIKPMLSKAVGKGSVANRVKQKIFSIQRSGADMDRHFARR